ncbi:hypothetical protein Cgig2_032185 [Carnegiea gigantea]|uniref:DUF4283 domain-containing protein n=1 Tax=Carnegiea gigantea TaxID=171969 RepID=A0A9Q1GRI7_9CARY|nr:hypothetical protein Cgig2_032185 [Carnegiea gigantea]
MGSINYPDLGEATSPEKIYEFTQEPRLKAIPREAIEYDFDSSSRSKRKPVGWLSKLLQTKWVRIKDLQIPGDIPPFLVFLKLICLIACRGAVRSHMIILELNSFLSCATMKSFFQAFCSCWGTSIYRYAVFTQNTQSDHTNILTIVLVPMASFSPTSPLSLVNSPNGTPDHHDNVSIAAHSAQSRELPMLDGVRSHHHRQPDPARTSPYANALKYDYIDAGNDWIMICFANSEDRRLVFELRPWHINGLNFVIQKWTPFFDSYSAVITHIDQWVRVPRLPWKFWDIDSLTVLLKPVGTVVRVDQNTLLRLKGTVDITGIVLANSIDVNNQDGDSPNLASLNAMDDDEAEGMDAYDNAELFLDLGNIEDVEMSTDSSKRKRMVEGEEYGYRMRPLYAGLCVAPNCSEQPMSWSLRKNAQRMKCSTNGFSAL